MLKLRRVWDPEGSSLTYRYSLRPVNCALRLDPPDEMVVVVGEPDRAVVEVNRVAAAAVPLRDDAGDCITSKASDLRSDDALKD